MIVILKQGARQEQIDKLSSFFTGMGLKIHMSQGESCTIMGLVGDTTRVDEDMIKRSFKAFKALKDKYN